MAARAIWKGIVHVGTLQVPVKLYSAVQDHSIRFRLLHKTDHAPVKQQLVSSVSGDVVTYESVRKAFPIARGRMVMLAAEELEKLTPEESRDIEVARFVDSGAIDHRWYERAYYLGPDGNERAYAAAAEAMEKKQKEGLAKWVMRGKSYVGALRAEDGYLMLIALRHAEEVIDAAALTPPTGRPLAERELEMAEQLLSALHGAFDPAQFHDEYRARVIDLVETKAAGKKPKIAKFQPRKTKEDQITDALEASLAGMKRKARG
ncbi:MAG: Ku protein [Acidobacteria bacterium]|nr:Ku protein [Acidobacteriota bacterium]MBV9478433.1 Ku protein [Acidobacteriota bacterium]